MRALDLLVSLGSYSADFLRVALDRQRFLLPALAPFSFAPETARRIRYYTLLAPLGLGYAFADLRGQPLSPEEARNQLFLAALTPLLDDAIDHHQADADRIRALLNAPAPPSPTEQDVFAAMQALWPPVRASVPDSEAFMASVWQTLEAQLASKRQFQAGLSAEEIRQLTFDKGGYAALLFRQALAPTPSAAEAAAWYHIGGMVQFLDDLFDVYEDTQNGIYTIINTNTNAENIEKEFENGLATMRTLCNQLPWPQAAIERFYNKLMVLFVRGQVAANQLVEVQQRHKGDFNPKNYMRKELITDMELRKNLWLAWQYYQQS